MIRITGAGFARDLARKSRNEPHGLREPALVMSGRLATTAMKPLLYRSALHPGGHDRSVVANPVALPNVANAISQAQS
jgi:hypothetical protein